MSLNLNFKSTHIEMTNDIEEYVAKRLAKLEDFIPNEEEALADVELSRVTTEQRHGEIYKSEINLDVDGNLMRAEVEDSDPKEAIDKLRDKIIREIKEERSKKRTKFRDGARKLKEKISGFYQDKEE